MNFPSSSLISENKIGFELSVIFMKALIISETISYLTRMWIPSLLVLILQRQKPQASLYYMEGLLQKGLLFEKEVFEALEEGEAEVFEATFDGEETAQHDDTFPSDFGSGVVDVLLTNLDESQFYHHVFVLLVRVLPKSHEPVG